MTDALCCVPSRAGMPREEVRARSALALAIARCYGRFVEVLLRPNPHWGFRMWPAEVLRWRRTWCEVMFWCGPIAETRWVHHSRLEPRAQADEKKIRGHVHETGSRP